MMRDAHYPYRAPIDAYGNGGFRFAEMSHKGALLLLPSGIYGWSAIDPQNLCIDDFSQVIEEKSEIEFVLLGTGDKQVFPSAEIIKHFTDHNIGLDCMNTGAACRTYNVLLAEKRNVAAAILPVD